MDLKEKVTTALERCFNPDQVRLVDDDGISGFVVSARFQKMTSLERQWLIDEALRDSSPPLSEDEARQVLAIAALTPVEYEALGFTESGSRQ